MYIVFDIETASEAAELVILEQLELQVFLPTSPSPRKTIQDFIK